MDEFIPFRFKVTLFSAERAAGGSAAQRQEAAQNESRDVVCGGYFSEVTGLELTMEPKAIQEGGRNWGEVQRSGPTKFSTIVLKRGVTTVNDLWSWFDATTRKANYGYRLDGEIEVRGNPAKQEQSAGESAASVTPNPIMKWKLSAVLPTKFKGPDLSSTANQVAIEELHLVHEGMELERPVR